MGKEIQTKKETVMSTNVQSSSDVFLTSQDLVIPSIRLMAATSEFVKKRIAHYGDIVDSIDGKVLAPMGKSLEFIPFALKKDWYVYTAKTQGSKDSMRKFIRVESFTPETANYTYQGKDHDGSLIERDLCYTFFGLLPGDLSGIPYKLSLRRTSTNAAKIITTQMFFKNRMAKLPEYATVFEIGSKEQAGEDNTYVVFTSKAIRPSTKEEQEACLSWIPTLASLTKKAEVEPSEEEIPF